MRRNTKSIRATSGRCLHIVAQVVLQQRAGSSQATTDTLLKTIHRLALVVLSDCSLHFLIVDCLLGHLVLHVVELFEESRHLVRLRLQISQ